MEDWLKDVPKEIVEELKELGLNVGTKIGNPATAVMCTTFVQKENKDKIERLKELGWERQRGYITNGIKYTRFRKDFNS